VSPSRSRTVLIAVTVNFFIFRAAPGDPTFALWEAGKLLARAG